MARMEAPPNEFSWPNPAVLGLAWLELFQKGVAAWTEASAEYTRSLMEMGAVQAKTLGRMTAQSTAPPEAWPWLAVTEDAMLRDELMLAGEQAERTADAVRQTLADLDMAAAAEAPIPLPD
jgi:hypothetical protein